jgi:hypothetical protein
MNKLRRIVMNKKIVVKNCTECPYKMYWVLPLEEPIITCRKLDLEIPQEGIHELCPLERDWPGVELRTGIYGIRRGNCHP